MRTRLSFVQPVAALALGLVLVIASEAASRAADLAQGFQNPRASAADLAHGFQNPPDESKVWCYWWWLNGAASREGITRDFEEMKKQGIVGALLFDAGQAGPQAPRGPEFMSDAWRELYRHAVREADRLGIALSVNLCSGWNAGGPWVTPEIAAKKIVGAATAVQGPGHVSVALKRGPALSDVYRDIAVLACPIAANALPELKLTASSSYREYGPHLAQDGQDDTRWVSNGFKPGMGPTQQKPEYLQFDCDEPWPAAGLYLNPHRDCGPKDIEIQSSADGQTFRSIRRATVALRQELTVPFDEVRARHFRVVFSSSYPHLGQENWNVQVAEIALLTRAQRDAGQRGSGSLWERSRTVDLTRFLDAEGRLTWDVPAGKWNVLRIGYTLHGNKIKCVGSGPTGPEIDTMSAPAMDAHFAQTGAKLIADAGPLAGKTLQYFHIDSWELGQPTWTPDMRQEFQRRRGYDPLMYLPALLKHTVDSPATSERFLQDYRRTMADLTAANYYGRFRELTLKGGLRGTHPESGGPGICCWIDALECEGINDIPMGEFWKRNREPDGPIDHYQNFTLKQIASAAHIYGKPLCQAEAFTSFGCDWIDDPWSMKDIGDYAFCSGLTRNVLCFYVHQPRLDIQPGYQWAHVGTHFDRNITWWHLSHAWLTYLARCQHLLQQGRFVADFAYFRGEEIPGFLAPREKQEPMRPAGFDYDGMNLQVLLQRAAVKDGRLVLPDGMSYGYLVLPHAPNYALSPAALTKIRALVEAGLTVIGPRPTSAPGLADFPHSDQAVQALADQLWGQASAAAGQRRVGRGRVLWGQGLDQVVQADGLAPDIEFRHATDKAQLDWIHRRQDNLDIYFLSNQTSLRVTLEAVFRVAGKTLTLWDAVTGAIRTLPVSRAEQGRTVVPLEMAPREAFFLVFGHEAPQPHDQKSNFPALAVVQELTGPWQVRFDPKWGGPSTAVQFTQLDDWTKRPEEGIRYYSGTAVYRKTFDLSSPSGSGPVAGGKRIFLDLGSVKNVARVQLNGTDLGVVWTAPWHVEITQAAHAGTNELQIELVNLWPNRLIGDAGKPEAQRFTTTNVRTYDDQSSGIFRCEVCAERKKTGQPAKLLPSGLLGPVTVQSAL